MVVPDNVLFEAGAGEMARDKANLDIFWLKDDPLADTENLPAPKVLAREIIEDLEEALEEFSAVEEELNAPES
jgi:type I restriction enzyme M protein